MTGLVRTSGGALDLQITLRGQTVLTEPYLVRVSLTAQRPHDVDVAAFNSKALRINFGAQVVSLVSVEGHPDGHEVAEAWRNQFYETGSGLLKPVRPEWPRYVDLPPGLISVSVPWTLTVLCDGSPTTTIPGHLTDVDWTTQASSTSMSSAQLILSAAVIPATCVVVASFLGGFGTVTTLLWV